jgi:hypothetical protein
MEPFFIDKTVKNLHTFCVDLEIQANESSDNDKIILIHSVQNIACFLINIFARSFPINEEIFKLIYKTANQEEISTSLKGFYILRTSKRILISEAWSYYENFFQKKINDDTKFGKELLRKYYKSNDNIPVVVDFLRETRNCSHNNWKYGSMKKNMECVIDGATYKLEPGKEIEFAGFRELLNLIKDSLKSIDRSSI